MMRSAVGPLGVSLLMLAVSPSVRAAPPSPSVRAEPPSPAAPPKFQWASFSKPADGPPRVVGRHGAGCLAGAIPLPLDGPGYQAIDVSRGRFYGHPTLLTFIGDLGRAVAAHGLGTMLVGDMAQARGGPMGSGHVSHQVGLDVDVWFRLDVPPLPRHAREEIQQFEFVDPATGRPDARWTPAHAQLIQLAARDPRVSRIFVGAAIKRDLCERTWADRSWLRVVRPWPGHDDHLHVRLRCPPGSQACSDPPMPADEGCDPASHAAWVAFERAWRRRPPPVPSRRLPSACDLVLNAPQ